MSLPRDPYMCLSVVNTKLRDSSDDLTELCAAEDADRDELTRSMAGIGYVYDCERRQFICQKN